MDKLHIGKLTEEAKTTLTEEMIAHVNMLSRKANCTNSELYREAIYQYLTGKTFSEHVANDRLSVMVKQGLIESDKGANK